MRDEKTPSFWASKTAGKKVDDIELFRGLKNVPPARFLRSAERRPIRVLPPRKKSATPHGVTDFLVDDIGLEPMTFRTSSGCSSQLS